jgi:hypothetical protein
MLNRVRSWVSRHRSFSIFLIFICFLFLVSLFVPVYGEICAKTETSIHKDCSSHHIALVFLWQIGELLNYYGVAITALATIAIAAFTLTLWRSSRSQLVQLTRSVDAAVAVDLPFIFIGTIEILTPSYIPIVGPSTYDSVVTKCVPPDDSQLSVTFRNYGRTPARAEKLSITWKITQELPLDGPQYPSSSLLTSADIVASNGGILTGEAFRRTLKLSDDEKSTMLVGDAVLWVYGMLQYRDFLNGTHTCRFCARRVSLNPIEDSVEAIYEFVEGGPENYRKSD